MQRKKRAIKGLDDFLLAMTEEASEELERRNIDRMDVARALYGISTGVFISNLTLNPNYVTSVFAAFSISRSIDEDSRPMNEGLNSLKKLGYATLWMMGTTGTLALLSFTSHYRDFEGKNVMRE